MTSLPELTETIVGQFLLTSPVEWVAVLSGVVSVLLANRNHAALYPTGIVSTGLYIYIMSSAGLYAESLLNLYYLVMSVYGWILWTRSKKGSASKISRSTEKDWLVTGTIVFAGDILLWFVLDRFTDSTVPIADAAVSATAWAGMWLLARHKLENWILLNISNMLAIPLLFYKGLPLTGLLTVFLFIVAVSGYFRWKKILQNQLNPVP